MLREHRLHDSRFTVVMETLFTRAFVAIALAGSLAACGSTADMRQELVGATEQKVASCLSEPAKRETTGRTQIWTYYESDGVLGSASPVASSSLPLRGSTARADGAKQACIVTVKLESTRVMDISYQNIVTHDDAACAQALDRCQIN